MDGKSDVKTHLGAHTYEAITSQTMDKSMFSVTLCDVKPLEPYFDRKIAHN